MSIIHLDTPPAQTDLTDLREQLDTCNRVRPHLRDLGDLAALDARRAALQADLERLGGAA